MGTSGQIYHQQSKGSQSTEHRLNSQVATISFWLLPAAGAYLKQQGMEDTARSRSRSLGFRPAEGREQRGTWMI